MSRSAPCYYTILEDNCGYRSRQSVSHCVMQLKATTANSIAIKLKWTPYHGWPSIKAYEIYRSEDKGVFYPLTSVASSKTSYTDSTLCDHLYTYYIMTLYPNGF